MSFTLQCNRCKRHSENAEDYKDFKQLDYYGKSTGHYFTVHLCKQCHALFEKKFMKREIVPDDDEGGAR